jgi:hypothetical protein
MFLEGDLFTLATISEETDEIEEIVETSRGPMLVRTESLRFDMLHFLADEIGRKACCLFTNADDAQRFIDRAGWQNQCKPQTVPLSRLAELVLYVSHEITDGGFSLDPPDAERFTVCSPKEVFGELFKLAYDEGQGRSELEISAGAAEVAQRAYPAIVEDAAESDAEVEDVIAALALIHRRETYTPN